MAQDYELNALTDIWTGDESGKPRRLIHTGLLGSIRWWFEVVVRGLGGSACDPTRPESRCPESRKKPTDPGHHCVVCELFGCTGWARKFRFEVLPASGKVKIEQIKKGDTFRLRFRPLRPICDEEWVLLDLTLRLIAEYGAIGGKTVLKPSDEQDRANEPHHRDYGLIRITEPPASRTRFSQDQLEGYISQDRWRRVNHGGFAWASLEHFWCVKGRYLARQNQDTSNFNKVIGREEPKDQSQQLVDNDDVNCWLAGRQQQSKKVFSFKEPESARRTFGFVKPGAVDLDAVKGRLKTAWPGLKDKDFRQGREILNSLFSSAGATP